MDSLSANARDLSNGLLTYNHPKCHRAVTLRQLFPQILLRQLFYLFL